MSGAPKKARPSVFPIMTRDDARAAGAATYFNGTRCVNGHVGPRRTKDGACIYCQRDASTRCQRKKIDETPAQYAAYRRHLQAKDPLGELLRRAKGRARQRGLEFSITRSDLPLPECCPCCGLKMNVRTEVTGSGHPYLRCPTIDRFDCALGYTPGNVNIICWRCNEIKRTATEQELRAIADWMSNVAGRNLPRLAA